MDFNKLEELQQAWIDGDGFDYNAGITIAGIPYNRRSGTDQTFENIMVNKKAAFVIYTTTLSMKEKANEAGLNQWIVMVWKTQPNSTIVPGVVITETPSRFVSTIERVTESDRQIEEQTQVIGDVVVLQIELPSGAGAIKGKVDTGADVCSLHADSMKVSGNSVTFTNSELSDSTITAPMVDKQAVKSSDGGVEYRPVIMLNVVINDKPVKGVQFNLNNRSEMEYKCLVGQNLLEKTGFMINPSQDEVPNNEMRESDEWLDDETMNEITVDIDALLEACESEEWI